MIFPINDHVQIKPISKVAEEGIMATAEKNYDEKGIVVKSFRLTGQIALTLNKDETVYFDSWQAAKYNEDTAEEFWLVPFSAIRAYEIPEK